MQNDTLWLISPIKRMLLICRQTYAKNSAIVKNVLFPIAVIDYFTAVRNYLS